MLKWHENPLLTTREYAESWSIGGALLNGREVSYLEMFPNPCDPVERITPPSNWYMTTCFAKSTPSSRALAAGVLECPVLKHSRAMAAHVKNLSTVTQTRPRAVSVAHILFSTVTWQ